MHCDHTQPDADFQMKGYAGFILEHMPKNVSKPLPFIINYHFFLLRLFLFADNMVDKTKVETSEAKAADLMKKVKSTQIE